MKKIWNKVFKLIIIVTLLTIVFPYSAVSAVTAEYAGKAIASFAINFYENHRNEVCGDWSDNLFQYRKDAYNDNPTLQKNGKMYLGMDCVGWVNYVIHHALGIDDIDPYSSGWVTPQANQNGQQGFSKVSGQDLKPGDIIVSPSGPHVMVYVGNGEIIDCIHSSPPGIERRQFSSTSYAQNAWHICRITESKAASISESQCSEIASGIGSSSSGITMATTKRSIYGSSGFIYQGMPETAGYNGVTLLEAIVEALKNALDWLVGVITSIIRIPFVGFLNIIEHIFIDGIFGYVTADKKVDTSKVMEEKGGNEENPVLQEALDGFVDFVKEDRSKATVTVENMVYNKVPFLDVNIFDFEHAGGEEIEQGTIIYILRTTIAIWYYLFRDLAIAVMIIILIYLGIKLAVTTISQDKAMYKEMLSGWLVGFALLFVMHYLMIAILQLNQSFIELIRPTLEDGTEYSLYETVKLMAYEMKASTGWAGTITYAVLVFYGVRFLYIYLKRLLRIILLVLLAPFVAFAYALNRINKGGKSGSAYGNWLKDFTLNVIQQSVHAIIYTVFIQIIISLTQVSLAGIIFSFVALNFMIKADKIFNQIFGFGSGTELGKGWLPAMMKVPAAKKIGDAYKKYWNEIGKSAKPITKPIKKEINKKASNFINKFDPKYKEILNNGITEGKTKKALDYQLKKYEKRREKQINQGWDISKKAVGTTFKALSVAPVMIVSPEAGAVVLGHAISGIQGFKSQKDKLLSIKRGSKRTKFFIKGEYKKSVDNARLFNNAEKYLELNGVEHGIDGNELYIIDKNGRKRYVYQYEKVLELDGKTFKPKFDDYRIAKRDKVNFIDYQGNVIEFDKGIKASNVGKKIGNALLAVNGVGYLSDIAEIAEEYELRDQEDNYKLDILTRGAEAEVELVEEYRKGLKASGIKENPTNGFEKTLQQKKIVEFNKNVGNLLEPVSFTDMKEAVNKYRDRAAADVKERLNRGILKNIDFMEIATELNSTLEKKGSDVRVDKDEFTHNAILAVEATIKKKEDDIKAINTRLAEKRRREDEKDPDFTTIIPTVFGQNASSTTISETEAEKSVDDLVGILRRASAKPSSKIIPDDMKNEQKVAEILSQMEDIDEEAKTTLKRNIWKFGDKKEIEKVLDKLRDEY